MKEVNAREKAMAFDISHGKISIESRFQRNTSLQSIHKTFGREASEHEIEEAKKTLFSVDHMFCAECEKKFTTIETPFLRDILPHLRGKDLTGQKELSFGSDVVRPFFLLQVYRTAVCDPLYQLSAEKVEKLRGFFNNTKPDINVLKSIPLHVTYLDTLGGDEEFTTNTVGIATQHNNRTIIFNDFIIQTSSDDTDVDFLDYYGLNDGNSLKDFTNRGEEVFTVRILDNGERKALFMNLSGEKAKDFIKSYQDEFQKRYTSSYGIAADTTQTEKFLNAFLYGEEVGDEPKYSSARFEKMMIIYLSRFRPF